jgi:hydrogenase maturation protein HypF
MNNISGIHISIQGIVQGVGFRPFVFGLANRLNINGWVQNTSSGVEIEAVGDNKSLHLFNQSLKTEAPPLALIESIQTESCEPNHYTKFEILQSKIIPNAFQPISPDICTCDDCLEELFDEQDRRFLYPFINCTNCGPRFTIINNVPYDRPNTTMAEFKMCLDCLSEYNNPEDRRFHAQPVACPVCGPHIQLVDSDARDISGSEFNFILHGKNIHNKSIKPLVAVQKMLAEGKIIAIKGLGGFHLACDALNDNAVNTLRNRKLRVDKPFAVMIADIRLLSNYCILDSNLKTLLESRERPIVILPRKESCEISIDVAPFQNTIGMMLPYTPLHYLLFNKYDGINSKFNFPLALVMTSGNISEEPISIDNQEAMKKLSGIADAFLIHDRDINTRCDDSVFQIFVNTKFKSNDSKATNSRNLFPIRRSRGFAPFPLLLPNEAVDIVATGAELKNTFCLTRGRYAFISQHIGDIENYETLQSFEHGIDYYENLFKIHPEIIAFDLHPDYLSTRYALERAEYQKLKSVGVQHHHAHIASCMADNGLSGNEKVIGICFDGTGYGDDKTIWGGEFLFADYSEYNRVAHLRYTPLPGGDKAIREPWRTALSWLKTVNIPWNENLPPVQHLCKNSFGKNQLFNVIENQIESGINAPITSSIGRLFDAVSSLIGVRQVVNYEAQAAIELENICDPVENGFYEIKISNPHANDQDFLWEPIIIDPAPMLIAITDDLLNNIPRSKISARFHNSMARMVLEMSRILCTGLNSNLVAISGGVWQNLTLLEKSVNLLLGENLELLIHRKVPANDGGISLGQAVIAANK